MIEDKEIANIRQNNEHISYLKEFVCIFFEYVFIYWVDSALNESKSSLSDLTYNLPIIESMNYFHRLS